MTRKNETIRSSDLMRCLSMPSYMATSPWSSAPAKKIWLRSELYVILREVVYDSFSYI